MVLYPLIHLYFLLPHTFRERDKVPSQPSLSQANQAQLSQPVLVRQMTQVLNHLSDPLEGLPEPLAVQKWESASRSH